MTTRSGASLFLSFSFGEREPCVAITDSMSSGGVECVVCPSCASCAVACTSCAIACASCTTGTAGTSCTACTFGWKGSNGDRRIHILCFFSAISCSLFSIYPSHQITTQTCRLGSPGYFSCIISSICEIVYDLPCTSSASSRAIFSLMFIFRRLPS